MTTENPDRRRILAGTAAALAGAAALNLAAIASARAAEPDPVFALIERHSAMHAAVEAQDDWEDDALSEAVDEVLAVWETLIATTPATRAGYAAVLRYVTIFETAPMKMSDIPEPFADFLVHIANAVEKCEVA